MSNTAESQVNIKAKLDGSFETTINTGKRKMGELGDAARAAGKGTGAIGDGMAGSAQKVEAATKNMIGSIQRQTAALEAGDKSSRKYQESLAKMRGIDVAALKPYLDQLDAMKIKQAEAAAQQAHLAEGIGLVRSAVMAGAAAAMAGAAGFAAFAKSAIDAADGMNDLSQRIGISVKELGKYQLAAEQSGTSMDAIAKGVKGLSENMLKHGDALRKIGIDSKTADGAMQQLADVFAAMPDGMEKTTLATKMFGKAGMDLIPMLNLGSKGLAEAAEKSAKFADQMALAAPMADAFNDSMAEIGMYTKVAGMAMVNDMLPVLVEITKAMADAAKNGGILQGVMAGVGVGIDNYWKNVRSFYGMKPPGAEGQWNEGNASGSWEAPKKANGADAWMAKYKEFMAAIKDGSGTSGANKAMAELNKELSAQSKTLAELSGYTADYEATQRRLAAMLKSGALNQEAYTRAVNELVAKQPGMAAASKAEAEALKAIDKARNGLIETQDKAAETAEKALAKQLEHNAGIGLSKEALAELEAATMLANAAEIERQANLADGVMRSPEIIDGLKREAQAMRDLATAKVTGAQKQAGADAADDMAKEQKKAAEASEKYWEDALMRAFESGKGFFESLWDTIKNTLKTQVLKVMVQGTMGTLGLGAAGAAAAGDSGGSGLVGSLGNNIMGSYIKDNFLPAGGLFASNAAYGAAIGTTSIGAGSQAAMLAAQTGSFGAAGVSATASAAGGASGAIATAAPYVAAAVAAYMIADSLFGGGGGPKSDSSYNMGGFGDASATGLAGTYSAGVEAAWTTLSKQLDLTTQLKVGALTSIDTAGDAQTIFNANAQVNGQSVYDRASRMGGAENVGRSEEALQAAMAEETTRILFAALKASDLPAQYKTYLSGIADSVSAMNAAIGDVTMVSGFTKALENLPFENLKSLSFDAAKGLIEMAGGLESLTAGMGAYYELFYTDAERIARTAESVSAALAGVGVSMPATKDAFRAVVDGLNIATESGRATYVTMLALAPAFAQVADAAAQAAEASVKLMNDVFDTLDKRLTDLIESIASERESVAGARDSILNGGPKTYAELQTGIAGAKVALPSDARVMAANAAVAVAAANVAARGNAVKQAQALTPDATAMNSAKVALDAAKAATAVQQAGIDRYMTIEGGRFASWVKQAQAGNDLRGKVPNPSAEYYAQSYVFNKNAAQAAESQPQAGYDAQLASYNAALQSNAAKVAAAQSVLNATTAAQTTAQADAKAAILDYAAAMTQYSGDAEKAVKVLSTLREETVAYYAAQKELAGLMTTSAANLREAVRSTRFGQLDNSASLAQQQGAFAQNYSLALSTTGAAKAGYADKLGAALPGLSAALMDMSATRADWALASANLLAQSDTIAAQLEADAGGMTYESESLALLDSIDGALGELDSNTSILKNAIDGGATTTAAGLRAIVSQLGGVPAFASGGYHSGGVRLVGENGPELEVTGPSNIFNASQLRGGSAADNRELVAEIRALREEVVNLRAEARSSAISNSKTARILERVTPDGSSLQTVAA